jgi:FKBP-type peptidyl-prolyl cis-trans isomerase SlyD
MSLAIGPDTRVTLSYVLRDEQGDTVDEASASEPLVYVHGYAQILPGLERDDEGIFEVDKADFPDSEHVTPGDEFVAQGPDGEAISMRVVEVLPDAFVVDTNHPLAGQTVRFEIEVSDVRAASEEEIAKAQSDIEASLAGHEHDGCCDHDHDHDHGGGEASNLVQLSKKH